MDATKLKRGHIYYDSKNRKVEFGYMGELGSAICYEPGDSGGGMQSSFAIDPDNLALVARSTEIDLDDKGSQIDNHVNAGDYPILIQAYHKGYIDADVVLEKLETPLLMTSCPTCGHVSVSN